MAKCDPFKYFKTSREIIRLAVMLYIRFPLSLRNVEDLLHERGIDVMPRVRAVLVAALRAEVRLRNPQKAR